MALLIYGGSSGMWGVGTWKPPRSFLGISFGSIRGTETRGVPTSEPCQVIITTGGKLWSTYYKKISWTEHQWSSYTIHKMLRPASTKTNSSFQADGLDLPRTTLGNHASYASVSIQQLIGKRSIIQANAGLSLGQWE